MLIAMSMVLGIVLEAKFNVASNHAVPVLSPALDVFLGKPLEERELLQFESEIRNAAREINYVVPLWWKLKSARDSGPGGGWLLENTASGFLVSFRSRLFYLSVGHKDFMAKPEDIIYGFGPAGTITVKTDDVYYSEILDQLIIRLPEGTTPWVRPGELSANLSGLEVFKTPLFIICNPEIHKASLRTGFYHGRTSYIRNHPGVIVIGFPGVGVEPGCSGGPVIGLGGGIRGMAIRLWRAESGVLGYAIPSPTLIKVITEKFFGT